MEIKYNSGLFYGNLSILLPTPEFCHLAPHPIVATSDLFPGLSHGLSSNGRLESRQTLVEQRCDKSHPGGQEEDTSDPYEVG